MHVFVGISFVLLVLLQAILVWSIYVKTNSGEVEKHFSLKGVFSCSPRFFVKT